MDTSFRDVYVCVRVGGWCLCPGEGRHTVYNPIWIHTSGMVVTGEERELLTLLYTHTRHTTVNLARYSIQYTVLLHYC